MSRRRLSTEEFIEKARKVHGDQYDYSLVEYKLSHIKVKIICQKHGMFEQNYSNHVYNGRGCPKCNGGVRLTTDEFISRAKNTHGEIYDYSAVEYVSHNKKIKIICKKHGCFSQTPNSHISGHGCPKCCLSKGENEIEKFLVENGIKFISQYSDIRCRGKKKPLQFDFYLPEYNMCIEYDGEQHYKPIKFYGGEKNFAVRQKRDNIKSDFCIRNNIKLIRIPYIEFDNIDSILQKEFKNG